MGEMVDRRGITTANARERTWCNLYIRKLSSRREGLIARYHFRFF